MRCSTLVIGLGSGRHRRACRRRGDAAWLSSRASLAGLLLLGAVLHPAPARAFPGGLDASFGTSGTVTTDFGADDDAAFALVRQSDGKLVAAGRSSAAGSADFALSRYDAEGELDPAFGTGGQVLTDFGGNRCADGPRNARPCLTHDDCPGGTCVSSNDVASALALQGDGKLVAAGERRACVGGGEHLGERCQLDADCGSPPAVCVADFASPATTPMEAWISRSGAQAGSLPTLAETTPPSRSPFSPTGRSWWRESRPEAGPWTSPSPGTRVMERWMPPSAAGGRLSLISAISAGLTRPSPSSSSPTARS